MSLKILKEGIFDSLQGLGEYGMQRFGVNPRGAMDTAAVRLLNRLLGQDDSCRALECHFPAAEIEFQEEYAFAIGGAEFSAELDGIPVRNWTTARASHSQVLRFRRPAAGSRCYIAVAGGLEPDIAAEAASVVFETARLRSGKMLRRGPKTAAAAQRVGMAISPRIVHPYSASPVVRVIPGPEFNDLPDQARRTFSTSSFEITRNADRMGYRLRGPALGSGGMPEMLSAAVTFGTIQLLPDGQLIVLMADHQTSGGYPRIGGVFTADLPLLAQLKPGDQIRFSISTISEAEAAAVAFERDLDWLRTGVRLARGF